MAEDIHYGPRFQNAVVQRTGTYQCAEENLRLSTRRRIFFFNSFNSNQNDSDSIS
jgi:hypothetical protein